MMIKILARTGYRILFCSARAARAGAESLLFAALAGTALSLALAPGIALAGSADLTIALDTVPDAPQDFGFTGDSGVFSPSFTLDDDPGDGTLPSSLTDGDITGTVTIVQTVPAGWQLVDIDCAGDDDSGSTLDVMTATAIIDVDPGESVVCTFSNSSLSDVGFSKAFLPDTIGPGSTTTLRFDIDNSESAELVTDIAFTDVLPAGITIATPASAFTDCTGGVLSAPDGGTTISLTSAMLGVDSACSVSVNVVGTATATNTSGNLTSSAGNSGAAVATLTVDTGRPGFSKAFSPASIPLGATSTLTFTVDNTANASGVGYLQFLDTLPAGLVIAPVPMAFTDCSFLGLFDANPGGSVINFVAAGILPSNPVVAAGSTCTISVEVIPNPEGVYVNASQELLVQNPVFVNDPDMAGFATAALEVPVEFLSKVFLVDPVAPGNDINLQFTVQNPDRDFPATDIAFDDSLPAGLIFSSLVSDDCGGVLDTATPSLLSYSGGSVPAGGSCTLVVTLTVPASASPDTYTNTTTAVTATIDGQAVEGNTATDELTVNFVPTFTKEFLTNPVGAGGTTTLRFTITNTSPTSSLSEIAFEDVFDDVVPTASVVPANPVCNTGTGTYFPFFDGDQGSSNSPATFTVTGASLGASESCTIDLTLDVVTNAAAGTYPNTTSTITGVLGGEEPIEGFPATDDLIVVGGPTLTKEFTDDPVDPGATVNLEFTLAHSEFAPGDATAITFTDDLAAALSGLTATGLPLTDVCDPDGPGGIPGTGTVTGTAMDTSLLFEEGTLAPGETCTFSVTLTVPDPAAAGSHTNTTSTVVATVDDVPGVTGNPAADDLSITGLTLTKEFTDDPVLPGDTVTLEFVITNVSPTDDFTEITFRDELDEVLSGLAAIGLPLSEACDPDGAGGDPGTGTLFEAGSDILLTDAELDAGESCTFQVTLTVPGNAPNDTYANLTTSFAAKIGGPFLFFADAADDLIVTNELLFLTKEFTDDPVAPGGTVTLEFNLTNLADEAVENIEFTDDLDAALPGLVSTGLPISACGGTVSTPDLGMTIELTDGSLAATGAAGDSCTFSLTLSVPAGAPLGLTVTNTTSEVTGTLGVEGPEVVGDPAIDDLEIALGFTKAFSGPAIAGGTVTLTFNIQNSDTSAGVDGLAFSDDLNDVLSGLAATGLPMNDVCGAGSVLSDTPILNLTGGNLMPGGSCTIPVTLQVPPTAVSGTFPNTTSQLFLTEGLLAAEPATADLEIITPAIDVEKATNGADADAAPGPSILEGDPVNWTYVVTNTGDVSLVNVAVVDDQGVTVTCPQTTLAVDESMTCTAGATAVAGQYENTGTATADSSPGGFPVEDSDLSHYLGIPLGNIIIEKVTDPAGDPTTFDFSGDAAGTITDGGTITVSGLAPGTYTSTETVPTGWDLTSIVCDDGDSSGNTATGTATFELAAGETVTCTFTNTQQGSIVVEKQTLPDGAPDTFDFSGDAAGTIADGGTITVSGLAPGTYTSTETVPTGWDLTSIVCDDGDSSGNTATGTATFELDPGETVTCVFNNRSSGTIVIEKVTDPPGGSGFEFSDDVEDPGTFTLDDGGSRVFTNVASGVYTVAETVPVGWSLTDATCVDPSGGTVFAGTAVTIDLAGGETVTCTFTNTAQGIEITKTPAAPQVFAGDTATFTLGIRNTGLTGLSNVAVSDPLTPDCDRAAGELPALAAGETASYDCETAPLFANLTNVATVTADVAFGPPISASATAVVEVLGPVVEITKTPPEQQILAGEAASFTITISNPTTDTTLTSIAVSDVLVPDCEAPGGVESPDPLPDLGPGQSIFWDCDSEPLIADLTNVATVTALTREGLPVAASASAFVEVIAPIEIVKSPSDQEILVGETASFTITLRNPGSVEKTNVVVSDPLVMSCENTLASLAPGEEVSYGCTTDPLSADLTNVATVTANTPAGPVEARATAFVRVVDPPIEITKDPAAQVVDPGGMASFTITVRNPGTEALTGVSVADSQTPACTQVLPDIPAGQEESYSCDTGPLASGFTNVATVTATAGSTAVSASASAEVNVREPIVIVKAPAEQSVSFGNTATFTITLVNEGTDTKTDVAVSDPLTPDCARLAGTLGDLAPNGGSVTYTCTTDALTSGFLNLATVTATGSAGPVTASDGALVVVLTDLVITKTPALQQLEAGTPATFTIEVTNNGGQVVTGVSVDDPATPTCDADLGDLDPGETVSYDCTTETLFADLTNVVTVSGQVAEGLVTATATAVVEVAQTLVITKEPPEQEINAGETADFTITVSNPSDVTRTDVAVSDPLTPACDRAEGVLGDLAPGESTSYTCTTDPLFSDLTNVATATAGGPSGTVSAFDTAFVRVLSPEVSITKTPDAQLVAPGDAASFTITIDNPGPGVLTGLTVADPLTPTCDRTLGELPDLPAEASTSYDCQTGALISDFTNVATVTATSETDVTVSASASAFVNIVNPIEIVKAPLEQQVPEGTQATFTITVTNDGATLKTSVVVTDVLSPDCSRAVPDLAPNGGSFTYNCQSAPLFADLLNTATVDADSEQGPVTASASALAEVAPVVAPVVAGVTTEAGQLAACDTVRTPVRRLRVTITGSEPPFIGADDRASYLLVGAGPDGDFDTGACAGGGAPADVPIELVSLSLSSVDPASVTADLGLGSALDPGLYRLLVCDTITDALGNALDGDFDMAPGGDFVLSFFRADPFNAFDNGHFDDCPVTLDPWITLATPPNFLEPALPGADDSEGSPFSASARLAHAGPEPSALAQCVPVGAGPADLRARVRFNPLAGALARFEQTCEFFDAAGCTGASLGPVSIATLLEDEGGAWLFIDNEVEVPAGAVSALCDFTVEALGSGSDDFDAFIDGLFLRGGDELPIFADGFESGI